MKWVVHNGEPCGRNEWQEGKEAKNKPSNDENMGDNT